MTDHDDFGRLAFGATMVQSCARFRHDEFGPVSRFAPLVTTENTRTPYWLNRRANKEQR